jgi:chromosomal replication initiator protein
MIEMNNNLEGGLESAMFHRYLEALRGRVGEAKYKSWFLDLGLEEMTDDCVTLTTGSQAKRDMLDNRYLPVLAETWRKEIGPIAKMRLTVQKKLSEHAKKIDTRERARAYDNASVPTPIRETTIGAGPAGQGLKSSANKDFSSIATPLDQRRTFDAFAVGDSNRMAWTAAHQALVKGQPRELIYFYGQSGIGKTHLLHGVAHEWLRDDTLGSAAYVTYRNLVNACVGAVWSNSTQDLHKALLENDLIEIDDIHFLDGKKRTQEELLIVIDAALDSGKQVVMAGELAPAKLVDAGINQRLADRLTGGLCVPISPGDETLRLAVLKKRLEQSAPKCAIADEVLEFIARTFTHSTRETIGALNQLLLMCGSQDINVDLDAAKSILKSRLEDRRKVSTIDDAIMAGAEAFGLKLEDMTGRAQPQRIVRARHAVVWCARDVLKESFPRIGKALRRDHTTVMSSYRRAEALLERDKAFQDGVRRIREALDG